MRVKWSFIKRLSLDPKYGLLNARSTNLVYEVFQMLDWKGEGSLDDIQFLTFMETVTDLNRNGSLSVFDIFDLDRSGSVEFDEFYLLICILVAVSNGTGKQFMFQHWRTCFELLDEDGSKASKNILTLLYLNKMGIVSKKEFETLGFLFNFSSKAVDQIYKEFDLNGNSELDLEQFYLFATAAIDVEKVLEDEKNSYWLRTFRWISSFF